jgi:NADPH:quinone reductase-like Zn-dependent oxidoreductase
MVVNVLAAGLHPRVRSQAVADGELPLIPGVDGVGVGSDGRRRYFVQDGGRPGTMAEQTVIDSWRSVPLPPACDPVTIAAGISPAMSSWLALRHRADFHAGQDILVFGAGGTPGRMAVQIARQFGAGKVIAAAREESEVDALFAAGAAGAMPLDALDLVVEAASDVDIVLDYMWGEPAITAMSLMIAARGDRARPLTWVSVDSVAGATAPLPSAMLRAAGLRVTGSGQGAVGGKKVLAEIPEIARCLSSGVLSVEARTVPLADVEQAWTDPSDPARSIVLVP